jgi:hypothetical protein
MDKLVAKVRPSAALRHPSAHTGENERREAVRQCDGHAQAYGPLL